MADDKQPKDDSASRIPFYGDVPKSSSALATTPKDAKTFALKQAGEPVPNEAHLYCVTCGWHATLQFEDDEMEALGGDPRSYQGPCPGQAGQECGYMTLVPFEQIGGGDFAPVTERVRRQRRAEVGEAADIFIDKLKDELAGPATTMPGSSLDGRPEERPDLPDAADVDVSKLKPREGT